ncbi:MAG: hypothetical protein K1X88_15175 [Nannocystaceae bacterium]|nr:hypothetical protein [Nannocystaceae bacterium]
MKPTLIIAAMVLVACTVETKTEFRDLDAICFEAEDGIDEDAWSCDEALSIDCNTDEVPDAIYVAVEGGCDDVTLEPVPGPFPPGNHDIVVVDDQGHQVCQTTLEVRDPVAPVVTTQTIALWPPNHKLHTIALADCFTEVDDCDPDWTARVTYVSSDEPDDDRGDGHTIDDVAIVADDAVTVRSERQGGSNGRVYHVGYAVTDGSGNTTEGSCDVVVAHDQGHDPGAIDDGVAYRVEP